MIRILHFKQQSFFLDFSVSKLSVSEIQHELISLPVHYSTCKATSTTRDFPPVKQPSPKRYHVWKNGIEYPFKTFIYWFSNEKSQVLSHAHSNTPLTLSAVFFLSWADLGCKNRRSFLSHHDKNSSERNLQGLKLVLLVETLLFAVVAEESLKYSPSARKHGFVKS